MRLTKEEADGLGIVVDSNGRASIRKPVIVATPAVSQGNVKEVVAKALVRGKGRKTDGRNPQRMIFDELLVRLGDDQVVWEQRSLIPGRDFRADIYLPASRVVVEMDGFQFHRSKDAFQNDRIRQNLFVAHGFSVLRYFASQAFNDLSSVADQIVHLHVSRSGLFGELGGL